MWPKYFLKLCIRKVYIKIKSLIVGKNIINQRDPIIAFEEAIKTGRLSINEADHNYAGNYMYMQTVNGEDRFKNKITRKYLNGV